MQLQLSRRERIGADMLNQHIIDGRCSLSRPPSTNPEINDKVIRLVHDRRRRGLEHDLTIIIKCYRLRGP